MRVLVTGAGGYIGSAVSEELAKHGHHVLAFVREGKKVPAYKNIEPVYGDVSNPNSLSSAVRKSEAVIHTAASMGPDMPKVDETAIDAILKAAAEGKQRFLYTSGIWLLGKTGANAADENTPVNPIPLVAWRAKHEQQVIGAAKSFPTAVIRPGMVYGRGGGIPAMFSRSVPEKGAVTAVGDGENRWPMVHVEDLAVLYRLILEKAEPGAIVHGATGETLKVKKMAEAAAKGAGVPGKVVYWPVEQARSVLGPFADALTLDQDIVSVVAPKLGWSPRKAGVLEDLERGSYARALTHT
ncbi:MAG TPA: NAD-dependent epimerase/dehydratase family protein [Terriglobales bacterium]|nr:NAD-dependent epimerase/dehydratase family protein [Terriglobales bacterium]